MSEEGEPELTLFDRVVDAAATVLPALLVSVARGWHAPGIMRATDTQSHEPTGRSPDEVDVNVEVSVSEPGDGSSD